MGQAISCWSYCSVQNDEIQQIDDSSSEWTQLVELVINNHLIMDKIAGMLSLPDLKDCRRVSKCWKNAVQKEFLKRSQIKIFTPTRKQYNYLMDATADLDHMSHINYSLFICDMGENFTWSLRLFPAICSKFGLYMKSLSIELEIESATALEVFGPGIDPIPSLEILEFLSLHLINIPNRKQTKRVVKEIARIFPNIKYLNFVGHVIRFPSFQTKLLQAMESFNSFVGGRFWQASQYPYSIRTMQVLTGMPQNLKHIDLRYLPPISRDAGPALENLLAKFCNSLEVFRVTVGRSSRRVASVVCVPLMANLRKLDIGYDASPYMCPTEMHLRFDFGSINFSQNLPILQILRLETSRLYAHATEMDCKPLRDCFFPENLSDLRCTSVTKLEINYPVPEYGWIFPNAEIIRLD